MSVLPIFPLNTVLFPGGLLPLRIFEPRYLDMVGKCMREGTDFGVVLIVSGAETGAVAQLAAVGTGARVVDFSTLPDGLLGVMCRGSRRFQLRSHRTQPDGLHIGAIELDTRARRARRDGQPIVLTAREYALLEFLARHPDAVGLDLGCGLDTRFERLAPPATVEWYDVDFPAVATARKCLVPDRPNAHAIGADVRDPDWVDTVPSDRPALIVADGLMAFLTQDELVSLLDRLIDHLPSGEIVFNSYTKFAIWATQHSRGTKAVAQLVKFPGVDDPHDVERWNPRLTLVEEILLSREPEVTQFPPLQRLYYRLQARSTRWSRKGTVILRYRF